MNYLAYHTDGTAIYVDSTDIDESTSITFNGNTYTSFEDEYWSNLVSLLEHFSSPYSPRNPIKGQLWYNSGDKILKLFTTKWNDLQETQIDLSNKCKLSDNIESLSVQDPKYDLSIANKRYVDSYTIPLQTNKNYIIYETGYCICYITATSDELIKLPITMTNNNYSVIATCIDVAGDISIIEKTTTSFKLVSTNTIDTVSIIIMGMTNGI